MPLIGHNDFSDHLQQTAADRWPAVTLICGEETLCKKVFDRVLDHLVPESEQALSVERFDGSEESLGPVLASLNTYALLSPAKVVVLEGARLFYSAKAQQGLRDKVSQAAQSGAMKKAARPFLNLLALLGLDFDDLSTATHRKKVAYDVDGEPAGWLGPLVDYCRDKGMRVPGKRDDAQSLLDAMQKGFPDGHRLLITTDFVDRRKALFKAIEQTGTVVDCTVPKGESRADRMAQDAVMQTVIDSALTKSGKTIRSDARQRLMQWTGFDLRMLGNNLEKLINYVGQRKSITDADVTGVLSRTRKDPIFEFTGAVADRNLNEALLFMRRLLADDMHPLQLLAAIANQLRRLLVAKVFIVRDAGRFWQANLTFPQFKTMPFKSIQEADKNLNAMVKAWHAMLNPTSGGPKDKVAAGSDLVLAKNPKSPFPVFQILKKAEHFSLEELKAAMVDLSDIDLRMKSTGQDPRMLLEAFLIGLCKRAQK